MNAPTADWEDLCSLAIEDFEEICAAFRSRRVREYLLGLQGELTR